MKKILLFMLPVMALIFTSCEKNNENELSGDDVIQFEDPNFLKALLFVQERSIYNPETDDYEDYLIDVDANKDGKITVNEAKKVRALVLNYDDGEHIDVVGFNIERMPEIKYFTSLEDLDCWGNQLTSLDLSNNTALTELECGYNQLTSLDVSGCIALKSLYCYDNQLTSLDVSNCTALTYLDCEENQLTSLNLSGCTALEDLWCSYNQLASLDVSDNTALTYLTCYYNRITSLDVSMCHDLSTLACVNFDGGSEIDYLDYESACPLEMLKIYKYHKLSSMSLEVHEIVYGDIIEYVE